MKPCRCTQAPCGAGAGHGVTSDGQRWWQCSCGGLLPPRAHIFGLLHPGPRPELAACIGAEVGTCTSPAKGLEEEIQHRIRLPIRPMQGSARAGRQAATALLTLQGLRLS